MRLKRKRWVSIISGWATALRFWKKPGRLSDHHGGPGGEHDQDQNRRGADAAGSEKSRLVGACACNPGCDLERANYSWRQRGTGPRLYSTPICGLWSPASGKSGTPKRVHRNHAAVVERD